MVRVALAAVLIASCRSGDGGVGVGADAPAYVPPAGETSLGSVPIGRRSSPLVLSMGGDVLVFGGASEGGAEDPLSFQPLSDGAMFTRAGEWKRIPDLTGTVPVKNPVGLWNGRIAIVVGTLCNNRQQHSDDDERCFPGSVGLVTYDPVANEWAIREGPPAEFVAGSDGQALDPLYATAGRAYFSIDDRIWSVDFDGWAWRSEQSTGTFISGCRTSESFVVIDYDTVGDPVEQTEAANPTVYVLEGGTVHGPLQPPSSSTTPQRFSVACGQRDALLYASDFSDAWHLNTETLAFRPVSAPPKFQEGLVLQAVAVGTDDVLLWDSLGPRSWLLDVADGDWTVLPRGPRLKTAVWTGSWIFGIGEPSTSDPGTEPDDAPWIVAWNPQRGPDSTVGG